MHLPGEWKQTANKKSASSFDMEAVHKQLRGRLSGSGPEINVGSTVQFDNSDDVKS